MDRQIQTDRETNSQTDKQADKQKQCNIEAKNVTVNNNQPTRISYRHLLF